VTIVGQADVIAGDIANPVQTISGNRRKSTTR
jgi:hypothetical protein